MEEVKFTHLAKIYGIPCFINIETMDVMGTNWLTDKLIDVLIWFAMEVLEHEGFTFEIIEEL